MSNKKRVFEKKELSALFDTASLIEVVASESWGSGANKGVNWTTLLSAFPNKSNGGYYCTVPSSISIQPGAELNFFIKQETTNVK